MRINRCAAILLAFTATAAAGSPPPIDVAAFDGVLQTYVLENGTVRYGALRRHLAPLQHFVDEIARISPDSNPALFPTRGDRLAYWINTYNALVLWAFARDYPEKKNRLSGLIGRGLFFYQRKFPVGGKQLSLATIENDIIRKRFHEPRIHFAIVCASTSCPHLARHAYTAANLEPMLEQQTKRFLNEGRNVRIDAASRTVTLSKLFDWYKKDFGATPSERLRFVARYRANGGRLLRGDWKVRYFSYDWSPNDAPEPAL